MFNAKLLDLPMNVEKKDGGNSFFMVKERNKAELLPFPGYVPFWLTKLFIDGWILNYIVMSAKIKISALINMLLFSCNHR